MKASVIIPALNEEKVIEATLKAIRAQSEKNLELIVADGNSTDKTVEISKKYTDAKNVVTETTRTIAAGRQAGARASKGELLLYTDADSLPDRDWAKNLIAAFDDKNVVAAFGSIEPLDASPLEKTAIKFTTDLLASLFNFVGLDYTYGNNMAIRRSAFEKIGGFNIYIVTAEDTDIVHRLRTQGKVVFVPSAKVLYSTRRIRKWGYAKYILFHAKNFFSTFIFKKPAKHYEVIR